ncbi:MAG: response regulator [Vicinamibacterales bacterium]
MPTTARFSGSTTVDDNSEALRARIAELETLCGEVYVAAVELGLPQPLLNRLWSVVSHGTTPHAFVVEIPPRQPVAPEAPETPPATATADAPAQAVGTPTPAPLPPLPDVRLTDRPASRETETRTRPPQPDLKPLAGRRTVCVVDDDPMMLEVLVRILRRENYDLITAGHGAEAIEKVSSATEPIDLLVTDFAMPGMKGHELADRLRRRFPGLRVLYQTGFSDMLFEDRLELEEGAAFLEKPFTARGLREAARMLLFGQINP